MFRLLILLVVFCFITKSLSDAVGAEVVVEITPCRTGGEASFRGVAVRGPKEAWVAGTSGTVLTTKDGGRMWRSVIVPDSDEADFRDVAVQANGDLLLMSAGSGQLSRVLRSQDGGKHWEVVLQNQEPKGFFNGFAFDAKVGFLSGDPIDGRLDLYQTSDGGATWRRLPASQRPKLKPDEYGFAASGTGIVILGKHVWIATGGSQSRILHSRDQGKTWSSADSLVRSGKPSAGVFSLAFYDQRRGIAIGGDYLEPLLDAGNLARTTVGGDVWIKVAAKMPHKACVRYLSEHEVLACGRTGVAFSEDGGATWRTITTDGYYACGFDRESRSGYLAGKGGRVARIRLLER